MKKKLLSNEKNKTNRLRLSYSLLLLWSQGRHDEAVDLYLHKEPIIKRTAFEEGKELHTKWEIEIKKDSKATFGDHVITFRNPQSEIKIEMPYNEYWDLVGRIDCFDDNFLYEFKSGRTNLFSYARGYQIPLYFILLESIGISPQKAVIAHYNQHENELSTLLVLRDERKIEDAKNWIDTLAPEIMEHLSKLGIINIDKQEKVE